VISVSHPFDRLRGGAWDEEDLLKIIDRVDAIEVFNARCMIPSDNDRAIAFAALHKLTGTAGSDAHTPTEYGRAMTRMMPFEGPSDFLASLQQAEYIKRLSPQYVHFGSKAAKWMKKLGLRPRQWEGG
jgi:predicted metal-dependent phosphoesterase TrpH